MSAYFQDHLLQNRRFLITGGTGGAGSRTAIEISRCGGKCSLLVRDFEKGEKVLRDLHGSGHSLINKFKDGAPVLNEHGAFDGIFHAAGLEHISALRDAWRYQPDVFHPSVGIGVDLLKEVGSKASSLVKDGGSIVFMSSVAATHGQTGMSLYCASKGAIEALVRAAAVELAPRRIRVNCIRAGAFDSPMHRRISQRSTPEAIDAYASKHLFGFGRTEDIANAALFLLGDASKWITATSLVCDGGYSAR